MSRNSFLDEHVAKDLHAHRFVHFFSHFANFVKHREPQKTPGAAVRPCKGVLSQSLALQPPDESIAQSVDGVSDQAPLELWELRESPVSAVVS
mmetsp:Transcript_84920/g.274512  ORF Transcript_84920/g.274512 Transcript_84920/m.274512 type:complete len:93 (-) Transcript_84920:985-1263(-)